MKRFIILAVVSALVLARPETYKEQEDFQYSRSSSDDGTKSGYYGAQRGNMGGNYERAHNMDTLAQHQMSGLVRQVNGDLGDGAKTRSGSVFSAANSRGTYGSGSFDLSNLAGRNFQEGTSSENSQQRSTQYSSSAHRADYATSSSQNYGNNRQIASDALIQTDNLQSIDNMQTSNQNNYGSSRRNSGYQSQAGFQEYSQYNSGTKNSNSGYGSTQYRIAPVRIIVKPGGRVAVPVGAQVYDATQGSSVVSHNALSSDDELTSEINQGSVNRPSNTKYYESSYRYNKKWEKHDAIPTVSVVAPTESHISRNSELYEDLDAHRSGYQNNARGADVQNAHLSSTSGKYNAAQVSSQSRHQSNYNSQQSSENSNLNAFTHSGYDSHLNRGVSSDSSNAYTQAQSNSGSRYYGVSADSSLNTQTRHNADSQLDVNDQVEGLNTRPKSYQSSYSYHKSWERQGDPYVIKPASSGYYESQTPQRLTSSTKNLGYTTYQPSSNFGNCDEKCHIRVTRSYGTDNQDLEQQKSQSLIDEQHSLNQQVQGTWTNLEDLGQQSQKNWDQPNEQHTQNHWDNLRDLSQQSQNTWDQQSVGQQSQNHWDNLEDLGQQSQTNWDQQNVGQQAQNHWDRLEDLGQQSKQDQQGVAQQTEQNGSNSQNLSQQSQVNWDQQNEGQQSQNHWDNLEDLGQQSQRNWDKLNVGQQTQNQEKNLDQQSQSNWDQSNVGQQSNSNWDKIQKLDQPSLTNWGKLEDVGEQSLDQNTWDKLEGISQSSQKLNDLEILGQHAQNNQDIKHQDDLYAQYEHKLEVIRPDMHLEHTQPSNEKENNKKVVISWDIFDNFDSNQSRTAFDQQKTNHKAGFQGSINENNKDLKIKTSYTDADILYQQVLQSHKINFNNNDEILPRQNDSNDNTDYSYSSGFVNPFFYQNHKNQLSNNENTYAANSADFERIWNSHIHSNSHSQVNWHVVNDSHINIQQTSLSNLWSKFNKIETGSALSTYMNHNIFLRTNQTDGNFTSLTNPNYTLSADTETTNDENSPKNNHTKLKSDKPETPQDIGRGDIGPEDSININESNNPFNNSISTMPISQNNSHLEQEVSDDQLTVLSLEQQRHDNKIVFSYNNHTHNILQNDKKEIKQEYKNTYLHNLIHNKMENQSHGDHQTKYFGIQTETSNEKNKNTQNYSQDIDVKIQNTANFEQENVNMEQENLYNFGQDLQFFTQQNENLEQLDLHNFHEILHTDNLEQHNLHNFGQEQVPDVEQVNRNIEHQTYSQENMLNLGRQNKNLSELNGTSFRQESVQGIEKESENSQQQYFKLKHNDTKKNLMETINVHFLDNQNDDVNQTNLSRVQKSVRVSDLDKNEDHLLQHFGQQDQIEKNYAGDYEPGMNSYEQEFDKDFGMQYQSYSRNLHNVGQENEKQQSNEYNMQDKSQIDFKNYFTTTIPTAATRKAKSSLNARKLHPVTPEPGFWKSVGSKITSAKNKIASWFKN